ncbi:CBO0543 family protein [Paenibacillus humicola]|uniref:CBO0543 family protein n=1 Tax=Paenibacillus humicola TaxID=3110540 RepID=UPI00237A3698|nr:CBO0543 family protein [Paenibacillus humicola]
MMLERTILAAVWAVCLTSLALLVPRRRRREAVLLFLFAQIIVRASSMMLVDLGLISNPIREFPRATGANFSLDYILYPTLIVFFCFTYPQLRWKLAGHHAVFLAAVAIYLVLIDLYTGLLKLHCGVWLPLALFYIGAQGTYRYGRWFFRQKSAAGAQPL